MLGNKNIYFIKIMPNTKQNKIIKFITHIYSNNSKIHNRIIIISIKIIIITMWIIILIIILTIWIIIIMLIIIKTIIRLILTLVILNFLSLIYQLLKLMVREKKGVTKWKQKILKNTNILQTKRIGKNNNNNNKMEITLFLYHKMEQVMWNLKLWNFLEEMNKFKRKESK